MATSPADALRLLQQRLIAPTKALRPLRCFPYAASRAPLATSSIPIRPLNLIANATSSPVNLVISSFVKMERPQKRSKGFHTLSQTLSSDAATAAAFSRNQAAAGGTGNLSAPEKKMTVVANHEDASLSQMYSDANMNSLTASLKLKRSDIGKETCTIKGYVRGSPYTEDFDRRVHKVLEHLYQQNVGDHIPKHAFDGMDEKFSAFAQATFRLTPRKHDILKAVAYGRFVEHFCSAIDITAATVTKRKDGLITIKCTVDLVDVYDDTFEQDGLSKDDLDYISAKRAEAETKAAAKKVKDEAERQFLAEQSEVAAHLNALAKKPIPYLEKQFVARGKAVFTTIKALNICVPTRHLVITRDDPDTIKAEITGYPNAKPYCQNLHNRIKETLIRAGVTMPSEDEASASLPFGTTPPKVRDGDLLTKWLKPAAALTMMPNRSTSAILYGKECDPILGLLYRHAPFAEGEKQIHAVFTIEPTGFATIEIQNVNLPHEFFQKVKDSIRKVYADSEGKLSKDEKEFERMRQGIASRRKEIEEARSARELMEELERELEKEEMADMGKGGEEEEEGNWMIDVQPRVVDAEN